MKIFFIIFFILIQFLTIKTQNISDKPIWPIVNEKHGSHILSTPQMYFGTEINTNSLFIGAEKGAFVISPFRGKLVFITYNYNYSLSLNQTLNEKTAQEIKLGNSNSIELTKHARTINPKYVSLIVGIKVSPTDIFYISGLDKFHNLKTGMIINKGDTLGTVSYSYQAIKQPSIRITRSLNGKTADPMTPLGLSTTFIKSVEVDPFERKSINDLKEDFIIFRKSLENGHPGLYDYISKNELDTMFSNTFSSIKEPMNSFEFQDLVTSIVRCIRDNHININTPNYFSNKHSPIKDSTYMLPISFGWEDDSLIVTRAVSKYQSYIGKKIETINGIPTTVIKYKIMEKYRYEDGNVKSYYNFILLTTWQHHLFDLFPSSNNMLYKFKFYNGDSLSLSATFINIKSYTKRAGSLLPSMRGFLKKMNRECSYKMINDSTAYLDISSFEISTLARDSIIEFVRQITKKSIQNLIIDVRYNYGGSSEILKDLFAIVAQEPFRLADKKIVNRIHTDSLFNYAINYQGVNSLFANYKKLENEKGFFLSADNIPVYFPNDSINYSGNVYVLANEHSFSAASMFAALIYKYHRGLIIGRETGNPYYQMFAEKFANILLPHSKLVIRIPLIKIIFDTNSEIKIPFGRGVLPNYEIPLKISELEFKTDPYLSKALELIARGNQIPKEETNNSATSFFTKTNVKYIILLLIILFISIYAYMIWKTKRNVIN